MGSSATSKGRPRRTETRRISSVGSKTRWVAPSTAGARPRWLEIAVPAHAEAVEAVSEILSRYGHNGRFLVRPTWSDAHEEGAITIALDPGMAFGTGLHPTTQQCLEAVSYLDLEGLRVLDVGTGSGILAIAAAKRGAREVVGVDTDPLAVRAARENAEANGVVIDARLGSAADVDGKFDVVLANLVGSVLVQIAPNLRARLRTSGSLVAAGITTQAERDVLSAFVAEGLGVVDRDERADWVRLVLTA